MVLVKYFKQAKYSGLFPENTAFWGMIILYSTRNVKDFKEYK
jgi:hypothetical protein